MLFKKDFKFKISGLILLFKGTLSEQNVFGVEEIILPFLAPQRPIFLNENKYPCTFVIHDLNLSEIMDRRTYVLLHLILNNTQLQYLILSGSLIIETSDSSLKLKLLKRFEQFMNFIHPSVKLIIIPSCSTLSSQTFPKIPLNPNLFPSIKGKSNITFESNPAQFALSNNL